MWVKCEDGKLYNLDHAFLVAMIPKGTAWEVIAKFALPSNHEAVLASDKTEAEATQILERLKATPLCAPAPNWEAG